LLDVRTLPPKEIRSMSTDTDPDPLDLDSPIASLSFSLLSLLLGMPPAFSHLYIRQPAEEHEAHRRGGQTHRGSSHPRPASLCFGLVLDALALVAFQMAQPGHSLLERKVGPTAFFLFGPGVLRSPSQLVLQLGP
jgi:hypothetical protein